MNPEEQDMQQPAVNPADRSGDTTPATPERRLRHDPLRDLAWFSLTRCMDDGPIDSGPVMPYTAQMSPDDALDVIFGSRSRTKAQTKGDEPREDS